MAKGLSPKTLEKRSSLIKNLKHRKRSFVKKYGKDAEKVMLGRATNVAKAQIAKQNVEKLKEHIRLLLKEIRKNND